MPLDARTSAKDELPIDDFFENWKSCAHPTTYFRMILVEFCFGLSKTNRYANDRKFGSFFTIHKSKLKFISLNDQWTSSRGHIINLTSDLMETFALEKSKIYPSRSFGSERILNSSLGKTSSYSGLFLL